MYPIKQNGIQEKFLKIGVMVAAIAAITVSFGLGGTHEVRADLGSLHGLVAYADWGSIHGEFNNPNCEHHCSVGGGDNSGGDCGGGDGN